MPTFNVTLGSALTPAAAARGIADEWIRLETGKLGASAKLSPARPQPSDCPKMGEAVKLTKAGAVRHRRRWNRKGFDPDRPRAAPCEKRAFR